MQDFFSCFFLFDLVLYFLGPCMQAYLLGQYPHLNCLSRCPSFQCLFILLRLRPPFPQVGHCLVFGGLCDSGCAAFFSPELLGSSQPISSFEVVTALACGAGCLVALP